MKPDADSGHRKRRTVFLAVWVAAISLSPGFAQPPDDTGYRNTVFVDPQEPTINDSLEFSLYTVDNCCCSQYYHNTVTVESDSQIFLSYQVDNNMCLACRCLIAGSVTTFSSPPVAAGTYSIYNAEEPYCAEGDDCPAIAIVPRLVGTVTVIGNPTRALLPRAFT